MSVIQVGLYHERLKIPDSAKELAEDDPWKYLAPNAEMKRKQATIAYEGKKQFWIKDKEEGYVCIELIKENGDKATIKTKDGEKEVKKEELDQVNPPKFEMCEDMSSLTYLNDASVLHNLRQRYFAWMIYTYSGLFCIVINPYKRLPIYRPDVIKSYQGKRRPEMPPHLFSVSDNAYTDMLINRENQSMLITGESGAGKTENTKKVIAYFALVGASQKKESDEKKVTLEDQIVQANPVLETFGNAKTVRNDNSSRFGKFIRIHFDTRGKLASADIESYLLEKSRVTSQAPGERSYHIFYQICSKGIDGLMEKCQLVGGSDQYHFVNQAETTIANLDDGEELRATDNAFDVLLFTPEEKENCFKLVGAIMNMGQMHFKQRQEQAEPDGTGPGEKTAHLMGVNDADLYKNFCKPRVKVGTEYVTKGQTADQVTYAVAGMAKHIYDRMFKWIVTKCNETLATNAKRNFFIGVLDIAGFEIFNKNGFEQLCINFTNEKLQQFFNHHMFILEQEEYKREGIKWTFIDFGLDLQACIDLIEKPMGVLAILDEESNFPKATDTTFCEKLMANHLGKSPPFQKPKPPKGNQVPAHFAIAHYAGTVPYNATGWLEKNKDPVNESVCQLFPKGSNKLLCTLYHDKLETDEPKGGGGKKKKKGSAFLTVICVYREQLTKLMTTLNSTAPHFVRCIIPNEFKQGGVLDAPLVMHQLTCNGVLEGIRICRKGFPNRTLYGDFKQRYRILNPSLIPEGETDGKKIAKIILTETPLEEGQYQFGETKVFFRAGILGQLEEWREEKLSKIFVNLQGWIRMFLMRIKFKKLKAQRVAAVVIQRNVRKFMAVKNWPWWKLYTKVKPMLTAVKQEQEMKKKLEQLQELEENLKKETELRKGLEDSNVKLQQEKQDLFQQLEAEKEFASDSSERFAELSKQIGELEEQLKDAESRISDEEDRASGITDAKKKIEKEVERLKDELADTKTALQKTEQEKKSKETNILQLNDEIAKQDDLIAKLNKEKKNLEEKSSRTGEDLQKEEDKVNHLNKVKGKLEQTLDELEDSLEREKKMKADTEKAKRKLEQDLKMTQEALEEMEKQKRDFEDSNKRKEKDMHGMTSKLEDEQGIVHQLQKKLKEMQARCEEVEEELEAERGARSKVEKQRSDLSRELEELTERLDEAGGATSAQIELNKKREQELGKLRRDLEESAVNAEQQIAALRKKNNDAIAEMGEQIDQLQKGKAKLEKDKAQIQAELTDIKGNLDSLSKRGGMSDKQSKQLESQLGEARAKLDDAQRQMSDLANQKSRLTNEANDLGRQLEEAESQINQLTRMKQTLTSQMNEAKTTAEEESRAKVSAQSQLRHLQHDLDSMKEQLEEEESAKSDMQRQVAKLNNEVSTWRARFETEGGGKSEEVEEAKRKMQAKMQDAQDQVDSLNSKIAQLDKQKHRLQQENEDLAIEVERVTATANSLDKKQRNFDRTVMEWKTKSDGLAADLDASQRDNRNLSTDLMKMKAQVDEANDNCEQLRRENKMLSDEIKDLTDQLGEGGKSVHEIDKARRRLELEKDELQAALEEAEGALEQEESKVMRLQLELAQVRQEIDRRLQEKDEEFETTRKNHTRALESMQASLEMEAKSKAEALRMKKKLETDINELEIGLDNANRQVADAQKNVKKFAAQVKDLQSQVEEEQRSRDEMRENCAMAERKANALGAELEEVRASQEQSDRMRRQLEAELNEAVSKLSDVQGQCSSLNVNKRKLEGDIQTLQAELDETVNELKNQDEKAKRAIMDAAQLAESLKQEQDHANNLTKAKNSLDAQVKDMQMRLDEAEAHTLKGGKRLIAKLESRVRELENEVEAEQRRSADAQKNARKADRRIKELLTSAEEDKKIVAQLQEMLERMNGKIKVYKKQVEEAEEVANMNLQKFRKVAHELEEAQERAEQAEAETAKLRVTARSGGRDTSHITAGAGGVTMRSSRARMFDEE